MKILKSIKNIDTNTIKKTLKKLVPNRAWNYMRARAKPLNLYQTDRFTFYPISKDPPVIYTTSGPTIGNVFCMARELKGEPANFIIAFHKHMGSSRIHFVNRQLRIFKKEYKRHNLVVLVPDREEKRKFCRNSKANARIINKNAFTREDQFSIKESIDEIYDAVMNARMSQFKRVELARLVDDLAMITVVDDEEYFDEVRSILKGATWLNFQEDGYTYLSRTEVASILNSARTGLILSASEGTNRASIEYLLCGLPVVSTPSKGGRDVFFDEEYCAIVEPDPEAVRDGVQRMIGREIPRDYIRKRTLQRIRDHRSRFIDLCNDLAGKNLGIEVDEWLDHFPRDLEFRCRPKELIPFLKSDYFEDGVPEYNNADTLRREEPEKWREIINSTT